MSALVAEVIRKGVAPTLDGVDKIITGGVSLDEANVLAYLIMRDRCLRTLETGVGFGISSLAICEALSLVKHEQAVVHYGIDPCQINEHRGAALCLLSAHGLQKYFALLEGPTHLMAPKLIEEGIQIDLAFIDGFHTFDYSLVDFFFIDKLLRPGKHLVIHDIQFPSKKKLLKFILSHRRYRIVETGKLKVPMRKRLRFILRGLKYKDPQWYSVPAGGANMAVLKKDENFEPEWHYFSNF